MKSTRTNARILGVALVTVTSSITITSQAQDLHPDQVPAPIKSAFDKAFPITFDVEWELKGTQYKVEFETGLFFNDHEVWSDAAGKMLRHEEEISSNDLPPAVNSAIQAEFAGYRVDDAERVTTDGVATYVVELKMSGQPEWKVVYGADGKQLQKQAD